MNKISFYFFCAALALYSSETHSLVNVDEVLLKSVSLLSDEKKAALSPESGVHFEGLPISSFLQELITKKLDSPITLNLVHELEREIAQFYQNDRSALFYVTTPDQDLAAGNLIFEVKKTKVGKVTYNNTRWFSQKSFEKQIPLTSGETIDQDRLKNDAAWANRNPFHSTEIVFVPGTKQGTTDVELMTLERFPLRVYAGADNTGIEVTNQTRLFFGANWGNAFGVGDLLTAQFTSSPDFREFLSGFVKYDCYLPWKHILSLLGGYAQIHPSISGFRHEGQDAQASLYYTMPITPLYTSFLHEVSLCVDYKSMNSNLFFQSVIPVITKTAQVTEISAIYQLQDTFSNHTLSFRAELHGSPFQWLPDQTKARYNELRAGAPVQFAYGRVELADFYQATPLVELSLRLRGQGASAPLLPSEQFGLGGYETVRGYEEHAFNADNAFCANGELRLRFHPGWKKNDLDLIVFADYGWGHNWKNETGVPATQYLLGVGPGVRWRTSGWAFLRADYGFLLHKIFQDTAFGRFHLRAVFSY